MLKYLIPLFYISYPVLAQDSLQIDSTRMLKELIVTYQADKATPVTFQNLNIKDLKLKSTGQEPSFLLSETPSITVYSDAGNTQGYSYYRMRGIDQTRINMTLDGVPLNEPEDQGAYFSNYPDILNSVSKIQIQRGVGISKNGTASYGGNIQLFSPNLYDPTRVKVGYGYGSFNSLRAFGEFNSGVRKNKALYIRASKIYSDGYKYHSSNNSQSVFISGAIFRPKALWKVNFLAGNQQNQLAWIGVSDSLIRVDRRTNANSRERDKFSQCLLQLQNKWQPNESSAIQSSLYYTYLNGAYDFDPNNFAGLPSTDELLRYSFESNMAGFYSNYTFSRKNLTWTTGIHANLYNRQHIGSEKTLGQLYKNTGYKNEASGFTKADYTYKKLTLFADIQYRYASFDYSGLVPLNKIEWHFLNPKAGISFEIKSRSVLYYSIGKAGREPTRNDMFGGNDNLITDSIGNASIAIKTPEYIVNQELGFRYLSQRLNFNLNVFYMDFQNEIVLDGKFGPNGLALTDKVERSFRTGVELSTTYKVSTHITLVNNSSFNYSRIKEQKEVFTPILTPPLIINQEIVYSYKGFATGLSMRYQEKSFIDFANTSTVDRYFLFNGRISYDLDRFQFGFFVNNITNAKYVNNGYIDFDGTKKLFVQAPMNWYASLKYTL